MTGSDYLRVFRSVPGLYVLLRPDERFTIVDATDAYLRATLTVREHIVGRSLFEVFPANPDDPDATGPADLKAWLQKVVATRKADRLDIHKYDVPRPPAQGGGFEKKWWRPGNEPLLAPDGSVELILHCVEDATELARLQRVEQEERAKLAEANARFQAIYDQGIFAGQLDLEGVVTDVNRSALEQCGFTREEVVGKPFWDCGWWNRAPDTQAWVRRAFRQAAAGEPVRGESRYFVADGTERVVDFACMPIKDGSGKVIFVVATGIDVTERAHLRQDLRATEILESITEGFFSLDREWRFTYLNREGRRILGAEAADLLGRSVWEAYPGLQGHEFARAYRAAMEGRETSAITAYYPDHRRWYEVHVYPSPEGVSVYFRNVTAQKEVEAERERLAAETAQQRRMYEVVLANTPDLVFVFDLQHRFTYANEALLAMWGRTREEALGKTTRDLGYPEWQSDMHDREIDQVVATGKAIHGEVPFTGTTGRRFWDYIFAPVLDAAGRVVAIAGTARDTTERREAEEAIAAHTVRLQDADRAKDEFIATLSHELRNPLAPLRNAVALLRMTGQEDERTANVHRMMERQVDHLVRLVDDLLELSRVSRGDFALRRERVQLAAVVRNAVESSEPLLHARRHSLSVSLPQEPVWVDADPVRLAQVVSNLLDNAAKYTPEGGRIDVVLERADGEALVRVRDNGPGIDAQARERIFQMFNRGDRAKVHGEGGLGIGLAISRKLAEMHGARLDVASEGSGRGSEFSVRIPVVEAAAAQPARAANDATVASRRILVVDDNRDAADSLGMILREMGAEVRIAHDGHAAIEAFEAFDPAAVLLDIGMPDMDGYAVARELRRRFPGRHAALIALTGWGQEQDRVRAREAGFDHHVVKPAELEALRALLARLGKD